MKKLLGSTLALALFLPASANAELLKNLKLGGQMDVQMTSAENVTDFVTREQYVSVPAGHNTPVASNRDHIGHATTRVMLKMDWDLLDDVHSRVTLVKGAAATTAAGQARDYGQGAEDLNTIQTNTLVQEAFVKVDKLFGFADFTLGRQFYGEPGDLIVYIGPRDDYGMTVNAVDMARFDWNGENLSLTGIAGKTQGRNVNTTNTGGNNNDDIRGLVVALNKNENVKGSFYMYNALKHAIGSIGDGNAANNGKNYNLYVVGAKAKVNAGGLSASAELARNFGEDRTTPDKGNVNFKGYAIQMKAAFKADLQDVGAFTPWTEFGFGTGDAANTGAVTSWNPNGNRSFKAISSDYRPGGIYGRFSRNSAIRLYSAAVSGDGLENRIIWGFGFKATPAAINKLTMGLAFYKYNFHTRVVDSDGTLNNQANSRSIGSEYDFTTEWKHSENVGLKLTLGSFQPGKYIAQLQTATNPATMAALDFSLKF